MSMEGLYIYTRTSSDMQRSESCDDQEHDVRRDLPRFGVCPDHAIVLKDEGESGTKLSRDGGFETLLEKVKRGEVGIVAVDDQSRLSRADNAYSIIQDLVFAKVRVICTKDGIDTSQAGWELRVKVLELHNSHTIRELGDRVRRGQEGRVRDDGSAGDFPLGYESYYLDDDWLERLQRSGPRPKKGVRINENEAQWIRRIFWWFVDGRSINWIARELTRLGVPRGRRTRKTGWHPQQVRRILSNAKYIGRWPWGLTRTIRNSRGQTKQVPVTDSRPVLRDRPHLRIIEQSVWERAERKLAELLARFGYQNGQIPRGPKARLTNDYPRSLLGGLLLCQRCGAKLHLRADARGGHYSCSGSTKGLCPVTAHVPARRAETALIDFLSQLLGNCPDWLSGLYARVCQLIRENTDCIPQQIAIEAKNLADIDRRINNLVRALSEGKVLSDAVRTELHRLEAEAAETRDRVDAAHKLKKRFVHLPGEEWLKKELSTWIEDLKDDLPKAALILRQAFGTVHAEQVKVPGKKRGFMRLRFRIQAWSILSKAMQAELTELAIFHHSADVADAALTDFTIDLGQPTAMDIWAPRIVEWRKQGIVWKEIVRRTGLDLNRAYIAWKRHIGHSDPREGAA